MPIFVRDGWCTIMRCQAPTVDLFEQAEYWPAGGRRARVWVATRLEFSFRKPRGRYRSNRVEHPLWLHATMIYR